MRKRKFQYIANNESYFIGKEVILNGKFRIFQEQYSEVDFKNDKFHFIIFKNKVFCVDIYNKEQYDEAKKYGISLGIPDYQVDFHPEVKVWER